MVDFMKWALTDGQKFARGARLRPAARERRRHGNEGARAGSRCSRWHGSAHVFGRRDELVFRAGTGAFALLLIVDRRGDRRRAGAPVDAVDPAVRLAVLADRHVGSGRRRVRRPAVHLGHAVFVGPRAADRRRRLRSGSPSSSPSCARRGCGGRWCSSPSCWRPFRRSSTACGASSCWCRSSGSSRSRRRSGCERSRCSPARRSASACCRRH